MVWTKICHQNDIAPLSARCVQQPEKIDIAIFRNSNNDYFALIDQCPHKKGPLSQGIIHHQAVTCPLHGWNIDLSSGQALSPDHGCTQSIALKIEDQFIYLDL